MELTLATYNVYNHEDFERRLPAITEVLRASDADVIALQEVPPGRGVTEELAAALGRVHRADVTFVRSDDGWSEALAVISRFPVIEREPIDLRPGVPNCLRAGLETPEGALDVYDCHLHPRDSELRQREVSIILERMGEERAAPAILCGDFNAVPGGRTMAIAFGRLRSAYEMRHGDHPPATFPTPLRGDIRPAEFWRRAGRREDVERDDAAKVEAVLDYVLVRPDEVRVLDARVIGDAPAGEEKLWASDHLGLLVRLELTSPAGG